MGHLGFDDLPLINRIFDIFDADNSSSIDYREMVCGVDLLLRGHGEETLRFCFSIYDLDDSGFIGEHELFSVLKLWIISASSATSASDISSDSFH